MGLTAYFWVAKHPCSGFKEWSSSTLSVWRWDLLSCLARHQFNKMTVLKITLKAASVSFSSPDRDKVNELLCYHRNTLKNCQNTPWEKAVGKGWLVGGSEPDILSEVNTLNTHEGGRVWDRDGQVGFESLDFLLGSLKPTRAPGTEELVWRVCGSSQQQFLLLLNTLSHLCLQPGVFGNWC